MIEHSRADRAGHREARDSRGARGRRGRCRDGPLPRRSPRPRQDRDAAVGAHTRPRGGLLGRERGRGPDGAGAAVRAARPGDRRARRQPGRGRRRARPRRRPVGALLPHAALARRDLAHAAGDDRARRPPLGGPRLGRADVGFLCRRHRRRCASASSGRCGPSRRSRTPSPRSSRRPGSRASTPLEPLSRDGAAELLARMLGREPGRRRGGRAVASVRRHAAAARGRRPRARRGHAAAAAAGRLERRFRAAAAPLRRRRGARVRVRPGRRDLRRPFEHAKATELAGVPAASADARSSSSCARACSRTSAPAPSRSCTRCSCRRCSRRSRRRCARASTPPRSRWSSREHGSDALAAEHAALAGLAGDPVAVAGDRARRRRALAQGALRAASTHLENALALAGEHAPIELVAAARPGARRAGGDRAGARAVRRAARARAGQPPRARRRCACSRGSSCSRAGRRRRSSSSPGGRDRVRRRGDRRGALRRAADVPRERARRRGCSTPPAVALDIVRGGAPRSGCCASSRATRRWSAGATRARRCR